jgi:hypothetical protein
MGKTVIDKFDGEYAFLSNFFPSPILFKGRIAPTVEHAFQAAKAVSKEDAINILNTKSPSYAKKLGKSIELKEDWEETKDKVMFKLVRRKFEIPALMSSLLATKNAELIEGNYWNDHYWGVCKGKGENKLGKILMKVRNELARG